MRLAISRRAAPQLPIPELCELARSRGLDGVELLAADLDAAAAADAAAGFIAGIEVDSGAAAGAEATVRRAAALGAPVVVRHAALGGADPGALARLYEREGAELLLLHGSVLDEAAAVVTTLTETASPALGAAWEVRPGTDDLSLAPALLLATTGMLRLIRLHGGGPELGDDEAAGTGGLVAAIAISGFSGVIVQTPSAAARAGEWQQWLRGSARAGCGTAHEKQLAKRRTELDIRTVEPKDRMPTILGAYQALSPGQTLRVTFDHDPSCMYYTLQATEAEGSFRFERGLDGPTVWSADVTRVR